MANYATSALKLTDTYVNTLPYNTCSTAAATAAKTVDAGTFSLETGAMVVVKFTVTNTAASPTLNVSSTGAKAIYYNGAAITAGYLKANKIYQFIYDGSYWQFIGDIDTNTNTDTGATSVTTTGSGNAVTTASYDAATRKLTLTKGTTFMTGLPARLAGSQGAGAAFTDADAAVETGFHYINPTDGTTNNPVFIQTEKNSGGTVQTGKDYRILTTAYSADWLQQIATDYRSDGIAIRRKTNYNGWGDWKTVLVGAYDKDSNTITFS